MALFIIAAGAAVLEVHRALNGGGKDDRLKKRTEELRRQLQVRPHALPPFSVCGCLRARPHNSVQENQRELERTKRDRELTVQEAAQLAAVNQRLAGENEELGRQTSSLQRENEELAQRADALQERAQLLEQCAESLKVENTHLITQFDRLKVTYEAETAGFQEQVAGEWLLRCCQGQLSAATGLVGQQAVGRSGAVVSAAAAPEAGRRSSAPPTASLSCLPLVFPMPVQS